MRAALLVFAVGCHGNPTIEITSPPDGTTVTEHGSQLITLDAWDLRATKFEIAVDNVRIEENLSVSPRVDDRDCSPCTFRVTWPTNTVGEGLHVISAFVYDDNGDAAVDDIALTFDDVPEITAANPQDEDLRGVGSVNITLDVTERGPLNVELAIDGASVGTRSNESCRGGCTLMWPWDTRTIPAGNHELHFTAIDSHGNKSESTHIVAIDDIVRVTGMRVTGVVDDVAPLEMEVYVFDNVTNSMLGCAGSAHGLGGVDVSDQTYVVDARLVNTTMSNLALRDFGANAVRFEVWEDDDFPVCPAVMNPQGNDFVGASPAKTAAEWKATTDVQVFGNVEVLQLAFDRPLVR